MKSKKTENETFYAMFCHILATLKTVDILPIALRMYRTHIKRYRLFCTVLDTSGLQGNPCYIPVQRYLNFPHLCAEFSQEL